MFLIKFIVVVHDLFFQALATAAENFQMEHQWKDELDVSNWSGYHVALLIIRHNLLLTS